MPALRNFFGNLIRKILPQGIALPILFGSLRGARWIIHSGILSYWLGLYELKVQQQFKRNIQKGKVVFDIGANVGFYSLLASRLVGSTGSVIAFEPEPGNLGYLERHIKENHCENVRIIKAAVSDSKRDQKFFLGRNGAVGSLHPLDVYPKKEIRVNVVSLDEEVGNKNIPVPDLIKIDVEGEEYKVLKGAEKILKDYGPTIILSLHGRDLAVSCIGLLQSLGYDVLSLSGVEIQSLDGGEIVASRKNL